MTAVWITIGIVAWCAAGFVSAGFYYAYFQRHYAILAERHRGQDTARAWMNILAGPCSLLATIQCGFTKHGWLLPGRLP